MEAVLKLLRRYKFDLGDRSITEISTAWSQYDPIWLRLAVTEALYRGRYKVISVEQILETWQRKQETFFQFDDEFERLVWGNLAAIAHDLTTASSQGESYNTETENSDNLTDNFSGLSNSEHRSTHRSILKSTMMQKLKSLCQA
ncbi:hypothetical protein Syn7502_03388 [Synechococcus sp. PCC 7502]|uniref:hypothetical protein n=1 Tax=Synechococcus sp. PCC 7502 TaxID=1173263 RepID=UPI00029F83B0|nr:hypothetical protein [Synechococcus sp. PCC 7502]AFY75240.1 hypothetical protein Syn7502_03388 [Synechococcus sp. PCC 7502]